MPGTLLPASARQLQGQEAGGASGFQGVWSATTVYGSGAMVTGSDTHVYISTLDANVNHNPVGDGGVHWQAAAA